MTVKELKEFLNQFPDDMEIVETRCSDLQLMDLEDWRKIKAIDLTLRRGYIMFYPKDDWRLTNPNYKKDIESVGVVKEYLHFKGN